MILYFSWWCYLISFVLLQLVLPGVCGFSWCVFLGM